MIFETINGACAMRFVCKNINTDKCKPLSNCKYMLCENFKERNNETEPIKAVPTQD